MSEKIVTKLSKRNCITIKENETLQKAALVLKDNNIGALPVVDRDNKLVGILSERDIARNIFDENFNKNQKISNIMSTNVVTCTVDSSAFDLLKIMSDKKIRHIPIVDNNKLLGIISIGDVVNRIIDRYKEENQYLKDYINTY
jgi:CBS domain-containing protein